MLNDLPNVTDPVLPLADDPDTDEFNSTSGTLQISPDLLQTSGVSIGPSTKANHYDSVSSPTYGSCEMVNRMRGILQEAATSDATMANTWAKYGGSVGCVPRCQ